ncbi:MAG: AhpC/TSA family protein [Rhodospirillales bacterium]|nr:AhpC/TSA family protein [Rhodospirillales bacterium]MDH3914234.1 AhpC/TSA family protein [Rhodospirillales bacterium]MDH3920617.1 AhpC/TSA family protein [Rhodospirillales bacterium]MDH3969250.1 AhpC/TSA family protein [Rhodospirillales bacterium]
MIKPRQAVPALEVATLDGGTWSLAEQSPESFTMVVFYRGLHCPICGRYLRDLDRKIDEFAKRGVEVIMISTDGEERARQAKETWELEHVTVGYGLDLEAARAWGLYVSSGIGKSSVGVEEPALFNEPGTFMVRPDDTLYFGTVQTMPFARPNFGEILQAVDFVLAKDYPARGEA